MEKSEILQQWIEGAIPDPLLFQQRRAVYTHLLGTAHFAAMLAMKRGADSEAAELAGLLHDISTYLTGNGEDHARKGAALALRILGDLQLGTPQQQEQIALTVQRHSDKEHIQTPLDEVLKDADVLDHVFNYKMLIRREIPRLHALEQELGLTFPFWDQLQEKYENA